MRIYAKTEALLQSVHSEGILSDPNWSKKRGIIARSIRKHGFEVPIKINLNEFYDVHPDFWAILLTASHMKIEFVPVEITVHVSVKIRESVVKHADEFKAENELLKQLGIK